MKLKDSWRTNLLLAYQSLGVVYGDLSISPLYVYTCTFADGIHHHPETNDDIFGVLSSVFWTLTLIPLFKYAFIVLRADDNGEGGTFALYSLICRHAKVSLLPNKQVADESLSTYKLNRPSKSCWLKKVLEKHRFLHTALLVLVLLGTCMVIGDGLLTPAISVFAAVSGLELSISSEYHPYTVVPISCFILVCLFALQHYGTHRIGFCFAPIVLVWLLCLSALGLYNIIHWNPRVYEALSPHYMINFFSKTRKSGWLYMGGILLCITGTEAMFADLGHFSYTAIQISFTFLVYPSLILAYMGEAAYLSKHHHRIHKTGFYVSVPESMRWPMLIVAVLASVVGSQSIISGTFSIINQSQSHGCFPRVKVVHTSENIHSQIYIPEINWILMILCIVVTVGFRDIKHMGNAAGLAVIAVMLVTTFLTSLVIILCWHKPTPLALFFLLFFGSIESLYLSASALKFLQGAWLPILLSLFLVTIMYIWHYTTIKKYEYDLNNKLSLEWLLGPGPTSCIARVPGIGLVFTDLTSGIPTNFTAFLTNLPAFHRILVFVCIKYVPVPHVPIDERYLVGRVGPRAHRSYRCIIRHGYRDVSRDAHSFESELINTLADFIRCDWVGKCDEGPRSSAPDECKLAVMGMLVFPQEEPDGLEMDLGLQEELSDLYEARELGLAFVIGKAHVRARQGSSLLKRLAVDFGYSLLRKNCRRPDVAVNVPPPCLLEVGGGLCCLRILT